jgi:predicted AAA+ superfamily ATPase
MDDSISTFYENIPRTIYLDKIRPFYNQPLIKILTGQRRVGKSRMMMQMNTELQKLNPEGNFIFIDKEKFEFDDIIDYKTLMQYVMAKSEAKKMNYLFIDEVQEIDGFEKALRSLATENNFDIYCTGSNANIFSGNMATYLSGRQIQIEVRSLSFNEFLAFNELPAQKESLFRYLKYGGLPYLMHLPDDDGVINDYLGNILSTILYRDVLGRNQIRDIAFLNNLLKFTADNTGNLLSVRNISDYLKSQRNVKSVSVIQNYLQFLSNACLINSSPKMDIQGMKIFESGEKYYFQDLGIRNFIIGYRAQDITKLIENAVYNQLRLLDYRVFTGKSGDKEIDFIAEKNNERIYLQVTYLLSSEKVFQREFGNLDQINDHYPKYVISADEMPIMNSYRGIKHIKLIDFLTNGLN